jgi:hypothetical protein
MGMGEERSLSARSGDRAAPSQQSGDTGADLEILVARSGDRAAPSQHGTAGEHRGQEQPRAQGEVQGGRDAARQTGGREEARESADRRSWVHKLKDRCRRGGGGGAGAGEGGSDLSRGERAAGATPMLGTRGGGQAATDVCAEAESALSGGGTGNRNDQEAQRNDQEAQRRTAKRYKSAALPSGGVGGGAGGGGGGAGGRVDGDSHSCDEQGGDEGEVAHACAGREGGGAAGERDARDKAGGGGRRREQGVGEAGGWRRRKHAERETSR